MKYGDGTGYVVLAVENQNETDYTMPLRNLLYEALEYERQRREISRRNKQKQKTKKNGKEENMTSAEYMSGFCENDRLCPVITLVVYYGKEPWKGAKDLYGLLDFSNQDEQLKKYVKNYELNLFHYAEHDTFDMFQTELGALFGFLRYSEDKKKLREYMEQHPEVYDNVDEETYELIADLTGSGELLGVEERCRTKKGGCDVCKAIVDMIEDGRSEGRLEGIAEGRSEGRLEGKIEGRIEGESIFANLVEKLLEDSRTEELLIAARDPEMRKVLYAEYHLNLNE